MLSKHAISRRMYLEEPNLKGISLALFRLETESTFALENVRLGHFKIASDINMPAARKAYYFLERRLRSGDTAPSKKLNNALLAWERALTLFPKFRARKL